MWDEDETAPKIRPDSMEKRLSTSVAGTPRAINTKGAAARHNAVLRRLRTHLATAAVITTLISTILATDNASAQAVDRPRPQQWERLVKGGRFMDRILPMPDGRKAKHTWGTAEVAQRFVDNGIEMPDTSFWGGNILKGDDGLYHMYVCGWPEDSPQGHMFWPNSTVYHAVAKRLHGPYTIRQTIGKGHNPEAYRLDDGRIVIYVIGGYYIADSFDGPWQYAQFEFDRRDRPVIEGLSNLTFARRDDGSRLMVCRGGGVWISRDGLRPYRQITEKRIYPPVDGEFEDPVVWRDSLQYHLIVNDWLGRIAYYQRSIDGVHWVTEQGEAYVPGVSVHKDGYIEQWFKYERPKIFQDGKGRVEQINFAVIDTIKWNDLPNDRHSSKNICLPMNKGLLIEVLNREPIDQHTETIELLIKGEKGFKPARDLDIGSLRLGSYTEVNFGGGAKATGMRKQGNDIVVTFDARDSGIDPTEFAPKLLGCNRKGEIIFGYAHCHTSITARPYCRASARRTMPKGAASLPTWKTSGSRHRKSRRSPSPQPTDGTLRLRFRLSNHTGRPSSVLIRTRRSIFRGVR